MAVDHYENFPVASVLLPQRMRAAVADIYRFARAADDLADEGNDPSESRLAALADFRSQLDGIAAGRAAINPLFMRLAATIERHRLPLDPFHRLLDAFCQDVVKSRYRDFTEVLAYCENSANPVGRLMLFLFDAADKETFRLSDAICTALQLINFWQDVAIDLGKDRIYLPQDEMLRFGVSEASLARRVAETPFRRLLAFQVERTRELLYRGAPLGRKLGGRFGLELRMIVAGGDTILAKLIAADYDVFRHRPVLRPLDWLTMLRRSIAGDGRMAA